MLSRYLQINGLLADSNLTVENMSYVANINDVVGSINGSGVVDIGTITLELRRNFQASFRGIHLES